MPRPSPIILMSATQSDGSELQITQADKTFIITYMDEPCGIRVEGNQLSASKRKYKKTSYGHEGSATRQVRHLNRLFNTDAFGYREV